MLRSRRPASALASAVRPRPIRPVPDALTVNRQALNLALRNLTLAAVNRDQHYGSKEAALPADIKVLADWLAQAADRDDYDARVDALDTHIRLGGGAERRSHHDSSKITETSGAVLLDKAKATYELLVTHGRLTTYHPG
ncbi:hypothetical protein [Streptosporangium sp. NPDC002524]|uniref:hypothetical protein n=1 Tax=Streptosporangium sp. NPDC002524 TaxID=3154537 RepID=UPI00331F167C